VSRESRVSRPLVALILLLVAAAAAAVALHLREAGRSSPEAADIELAEGTLERLRSLGYAEWVDLEEESALQAGIVVNDTERSYPGINIYNSRPRSEAHLMAMDGRILHTWSSHHSRGWHHIEMDDEGNLFVIQSLLGLMKLDWDSNIVWHMNTMAFHHDLAIASNGDIYGLSRVRRVVSFEGEQITIEDDRITILSPEGDVKKLVSCYDLLGAYLYRGKRKEEDLYKLCHFNNVEVLERDVPGFSKKGQVLVSLRNVNIIAVVDLDEEKIVWKWGEADLDAQHHPALLGNDNILVFDNGSSRGYSRIIEVNPRTEQIEWEYRADPPMEFFSYGRGGNQKLPNGNVLITESDEGRVFEITPDGEVVWEFFNPDVNPRKGKRAAIYRFMRLMPEMTRNLALD